MYGRTQARMQAGAHATRTPANTPDLNIQQLTTLYHMQLCFNVWKTRGRCNKHPQQVSMKLKALSFIYMSHMVKVAVANETF
eukprot:2493966-Pleurochrysis_carterae.AAC.1